MNRYKFPIDVFRNISDALPTGVHLGFIGDNLVDCYATENDINKLKSTGINLDVITQALKQYQSTHISDLDVLEQVKTVSEYS